MDHASCLIDSITWFILKDVNWIYISTRYGGHFSNASRTVFRVGNRGWLTPKSDPIVTVSWQCFGFAGFLTTRLCRICLFIQQLTTNEVCLMGAT